MQIVPHARNVSVGLWPFWDVSLHLQALNVWQVVPATCITHMQVVLVLDALRVHGLEESMLMHTGSLEFKLLQPSL